jgi:hypothetical protein
MRHRNIRNMVRGTTLVALAGLCALPVAASHSIFVSLPPHSEEALTWCGPATAQMIMEGYPSGACTKPQDEIWVAIEAGRTEAAWDTDPQGMKSALMSLCPPPGGSWSIFSNASAQALMHSVAFWMTQRQYPAAVVLATASHNSYAPHQEHWVAIRGLVTDNPPVTHPTVNLEMVWFTDPAVPLGDPPLQRLVTGSTWYTEFQAVTKAASAYNGKFVAVIEPPPSKGRAVAPAEVLTGRVIQAARALQIAAQQLGNPRIAQFEPFRKLRGTKPMAPLLVNAQRGGYYLIPLTANGKDAIGAMLLNAYTGGLQEVGTFAPTRFVSQKDAVERALRTAGKVDPAQVRSALVSTPEAGASRYRPAWKVEVAGRSVIVRQDERRDPR